MNENFETSYQDLTMLQGVPEATELFKVELQKALDETQRAVEFAMTADEFEGVRLRLPLLRKMLEAQTSFLKNLREKVLAEMWPSEALEAGQEVTN